MSIDEGEDDKFPDIHTLNRDRNLSQYLRNKPQLQGPADEVRRYESMAQFKKLP